MFERQLHIPVMPGMTTAIMQIVHTQIFSDTQVPVIRPVLIIVLDEYSYLQQLRDRSMNPDQNRKEQYRINTEQDYKNSIS